MLAPSEPYDQCGVFTGCLYPRGPRGEADQLTVLYTSACHLPINWALPYTRNSAGLAMATSADGGLTWNKSSQCNPILAGEPEGVVVTGWRDPFVGVWPALDRLRGLADVADSLYGIISGGISGGEAAQPALFLYAVSRDDVSRWDYLGPLVHFTKGSYRRSCWTGDYGVNWECGNFLTLGNGADERQFILVGSEGGVRDDVSLDASNRHGSWLLWMSGALTLTEDGPRFVPGVFGLLDHGLFYAASSYEHPLTKQRVVWGWLKEDVLALARREDKGWAGFQALPRELFLLRLEKVVETLKTPLKEIDSLVVEKEIAAATNSERDTKIDTETNIVYTLGIRPLPSLERLRRGDGRCWEDLATSSQLLMNCRSPCYELMATIRIHPSPNRLAQQRVGFHLRHNADLSQRVSVYFDVHTETIVLDRSQTNDEEGMPRDSLSGPFTLFRHQDTGWEPLHLRIFGDGDTIEVFANDRFALSAVAYIESSFLGISSFVMTTDDTRDSAVVWERVCIWDDMDSCLVCEER